MNLQHLVSIGLAQSWIAPRGPKSHQTSSERKRIVEDSVRFRSDINVIVERIVEKVTSGALDFENWTPAKKWRASEPYRFPNDPSLSSPQLVRQLIGEALNPKKRLSEFLNDLGLWVEDVLPPSVFQPITFNVFGCPHSTDIDIVALAPSADVVQKIQSGEIQVDANAVRTQLNELGYDSSRALDLRIVSIQERGELEMCAGTPGNKLIQNMVYGTFDLHRQKYPCVFAHSAEVDLLEQLRAIAKVVLDNARMLSSGSVTLRGLTEKERRAALTGCGSDGKGDAWRRLDCAVEILDNMEVSCHSSDQAELMKQLCMKVMQIALLTHGKDAYTKNDMLQKAADMFRYGEGLRYLLFLGHQGDAFQVGNALDELRKVYRDAIDSCRNAITWSISSLPDRLRNPTELPDNTFASILQSPLSVPMMVRKWFYEVHLGPAEAPSLPKFILRSSPADVIPTWLRPRVEFADQRSETWLDLYNFYTCGRHSNVPVCTDRDAFLDDYYHLVRGCVMEMVLMYSLDYKKLLNLPIVTSASVGLIVAEKGLKDADGVAPDLLLIIPDLAHGDDHVVPVEMKTMNETFAENGNYRREVKLATWQLRRACDLIGRGRCGLMMMNWWENGHWELRCAFINVDTGCSIADDLLCMLQAQNVRNHALDPGALES